MFETFQSQVQKTINHLGLQKQMEGAHVCSIARDILAAEFPRLVKIVKIRSFKENTVFVYTKGSVASQELFYNKAKFIKLINQKLGKESVKKLSLTLKEKALD